ncbi:MAG: alpha-hydroxy-acid oxidizing protein [Burkholderiales bacterium]|nr:alpha-hydroxy-acid oxidizing protein [Burkholderiales bacterium]
MKSPALQALPPDITCAGDYEPHARAALGAEAWAFLSSHAGTGQTVRANRQAWDAIALLPRVLRGVRAIDTGSQLFGRPLPWPVLGAPMALQRLAHPDGEVALAVAASALGAGLVLGSQSSIRLETVASAFGPASGRGPLWFQLYLLPDRGATLDLVRRAEDAGCEALVLTVDASARAARPQRLPPGISAVHVPPQSEGATSLQELLARAPTWDDVAWLRAHTRLPLVLKGVLHPGDAREAQRQGVAGLIVSNHGGRVLDGAAATAAALPAIADAVAGTLPVLVDGGIQRGTDVLKALALGASAVLVGRPLLWGLASAGAAGVAHVLRLLRDELELAMAQCGAAALPAIRTELLALPQAGARSSGWL